MSTFPNSPLLKGALIGVDMFKPLASVVVFQYNPETMMRRLESHASGGGNNSDRSEAFRLTEPSKETIMFNIKLEAVDQLEQPKQLANAFGMSLTFALLEILLYFKSFVKAG
jgi:hypothetical protein